jgi:hypothetical protein
MEDPVIGDLLVEVKHRSRYRGPMECIFSLFHRGGMFTPEIRSLFFGSRLKPNHIGLKVNPLALYDNISCVSTKTRYKILYLNVV